MTQEAAVWLAAIFAACGIVAYLVVLGLGLMGRNQRDDDADDEDLHSDGPGTGD